MKLKISFIVLIFIGLSFSGYSQATANDELDAAVALLGVQKKQVVAELVNITKADSVNFWKVYNAFEVEQSKFRKTRIQAYERLVNAYSTMDVKTADQLAKDFFELRNGQEKLLLQYYEKMKAATNAVVAIQFYQAETYILTLARANIMQQIPTYGQVLKKAHFAN